VVLLASVVVGLFVGIARGGSLSGFSQARFAYLPVLLAALVVQLVIFVGPVARMEETHRVGPYVYMATLLATLFALWANRSIPGITIVLVGATLNAAVIFANGGFMPTPHSALESAGRLEYVIQEEADRAAGKRLAHTNSVIASDETRLSYLGDVLYIPEGYPAANVISLGDLFIALGAGVATAKVMLLGKEERRGRSQPTPVRG
jgi:hypothetical protein